MTNTNITPPACNRCQKRLQKVLWDEYFPGMIPRMISYRAFLGLIGWVTLLTAILPATAQTRDSSYQEKPGLALIKPQAWSKESDATVFIFGGFIDRTAAGGGGAGYYEFYTPKGQKRQVEAAKVVKMVIYPDAERIPDLADPQARKRVQETTDEISQITVKFPATKTYIQPYLAKLQSMLARYDGGEVKVEGDWMAKEKYINSEALKLKELLMGDISRAKPPGSFDLVNDPRYLALAQFAEEVPDVKKVQQEVAEKQAMQERGQKRKLAMEKLQDVTLPLADAQKQVEEIKKLNPQEDPIASILVSKWDKSTETAAKLKKEGATLAGHLETASASAAPDSIPTLNEETLNQASDFSQEIAIFVATQPPAQVMAEVKQARAVALTIDDFKRLQVLFPSKQYLEAKGIVDELARKVSDVGPETTRVVGGLQKTISGKVESFTQLREEAKVFAEAGDKAKALAKYEEAFSLIADPGITEQIRLIKEETPAKPN